MFNTLKYAKMLEEVGFSRVQAETSIKILAETMEDKLATKQDLKDLETRMTSSIAQLDAKVDSSVAQLDAKIDSSVAQLHLKIDSSVARLDSKIDHMAAQLESKMDRLESKLTVRLGLMFAAGITVLTALQKLTGIH